MATTTKSTRKKPAAATKSAKAKTTKTVSARTKTAAQTKKAAKQPAAASSKSRTTVLSPLEKLRGMNLSSALLYLLFAGFVIAFAKTAEIAVTLAVQARDEFASDNSVVLGTAHETFYNLEPKYVLAASLIVSAVSGLLLATKFRGSYEAAVTNRTSGWRWVVLGLSSALTLTFVNMLAGVQDFATLKLSAALVFTTAMLGWIAERDNRGAVRPKWLAYDLSLLTGTLAWLPIITTFIGTTVYGNERFGWHVYAIAAVTLLGFLGFALNLYRQIRGNTVTTDYPSAELRYLRIDLFTKFLIVLLVLIALK